MFLAKEILEKIPHRPPLLMLDGILEQSANSIKAFKNVSVNESHFRGHFPDAPVMPGVLMIEAMAQTAAILSFLTMGQKPDENTIVYFLGIDGARFKRPVEPGDQLKMEVEIIKVARGIWKYKARATVDGQLAVEGELMCTMRTKEEAKES